MSTSESFEALRRANPRAKPGFAQGVESAAAAVEAQIAAASQPVGGRRRGRRRLVGLSTAGVSLAVAAAAALFLTVGSPSSGPAVEDAAAAVRKAATVTAASADRSGVAVVRLTHNGEPWAGATIRWHDRDVSVSQDAPARPGKAGGKLFVVDGVVYTLDAEEGGWVMAGSPENIDPGSGTTPGEYLAAARQDAGGVTLRRVTAGMEGLQTQPLDNGSTVFSGTVAAGLIATESGFKEGRLIRVFPFGYVAHDEAADPAAQLDTAVTVGPNGLVRKIAVSWGIEASAWTYQVTYSGLGTTARLVAPANARSLRERLPVAPSN